MLNDVLGLSDKDETSAFHIPYEDRGAGDPDEEEDEDAGVFANGIILIQYDPLQEMRNAPDQNCATQVAAIEVWHEELSAEAKYRDEWPALPAQIAFEEPGLERRHVGLEYGNILRRQGGLCIRPSGTMSATKTVTIETTLRTSVVPASNSVAISDSSSATHEPKPSPTPKSKALSVVLRTSMTHPVWNNLWAFYETTVGVAADICAPNATLYDNERIWSDMSSLHKPPWPHGTFVMSLHGEDNCKYLNDGNGAGILHCPSFGDGNNVGCKEETEKSLFGAITDCPREGVSGSAHRVVYCEW